MMSPGWRACIRDKLCFVFVPSKWRCVVHIWSLLPPEAQHGDIFGAEPGAPKRSTMGDVTVTRAGVSVRCDERADEATA